MIIHECKDGVFVFGERFDLIKTLHSGQMFRYEEHSDHILFAMKDRVIAARIEKPGVLFLGETTESFRALWDYFDFDFSMEECENTFPQHPLIQEAVAYGKGLRMLRQDTWEVVLGFLLSQNNHVPRIRALMDTLAKTYGRYVRTPYGSMYLTPRAHELIASEEDLRELKCGYRAPYIAQMAQKVRDGIVDLDAMRRMGSAERILTLRKLHGIGPKVADCISLYGFHDFSRIPMDTWMKKAVKAIDGISPDNWGPYPAVLQQYLFFTFLTTRGRLENASD